MLNPQEARSFDKRFAAIQSIAPGGIVSEKERYKLTIKDVMVGGVIRFGNKTFLVKETGLYNETDESYQKKKKYRFFELKLFCLETGEIVNIEWEEDDEIEISLTTGTLEFCDLRDDEGKDIDEDDLDQIVDDEDSVYVNGREFRYSDDYAALYYRNQLSADPEKVYFYEFKVSDGTELTIEEWVVGPDKEEYQLYYSRQMDPSEIEVIHCGGED